MPMVSSHTYIKLTPYCVAKLYNDPHRGLDLLHEGQGDPGALRLHVAADNLLLHAANHASLRPCQICPRRLRSQRSS